MRTSRLEAFSDGVLAIIITIMVLGLRVPEGNDLRSLWDSAGGTVLTYVLSFIYVGIYWNNHHHMFQLTQRVSGGVLWANLHLLFWLSLFPFSTAWMDRSNFSRTPVMVFGIDLLGAAIAFFILQRTILRREVDDAPLARALGRDLKGKISPVFYICGIVAASFSRQSLDAAIWVALACYVAVAVIWLVPDRRIERMLTEEHRSES
ncbi:TMEM175 family protein [Xylanimonas sp. McL0601]|uniref:TMEM175 family protein n=1 Tax=Xylanimonas sp. McL0601 TaxID=3414739 RepID=UPI003CEF996D